MKYRYAIEFTLHSGIESSARVNTLWAARLIARKLIENCLVVQVLDRETGEVMWAYDPAWNEIFDHTYLD